MEEELAPLAASARALALEALNWLDARLLSLASAYQLAAMAAALAAAFLAHRLIRRALERIAARPMPRLLRQALRTASSISLPVAWTAGMWISMAVLRDFGQPVALLRLTASLVNAWVAIRIVTVLIPSAGWASAFAWCAWSVAALNALGLLDPTVETLREIGLNVGGARITAWSALKGAALTAALVWGANLASGLLEGRLQRARAMSPSMRVLIGKAARYLAIALAITAGLGAAGIDLTALAIFSGAIGVGIGLGMQRTVANLVAGFALLADRSLKPGDVIEIETASGATYGVVRMMGARYVAVQARDGTETLIPNELLITSPVTNWTYSNKAVRRSISVGVAYSSDVEKAMELCLDAARRTPRVLRAPEPVCLLRGFGDSSVDLELRIWIDDPEGGVSNVASEVNLHIWRLFRAHGIEIPFPQRDVNFRTPLPVELRRPPRRPEA
ncbi:mechanosensitive ion channel family protein [Oceanicella actignis]|uniref:mechanosensitive ion channel family protein n=1 Tax=Oceanicella actignis TaxID=1189325 RepID=UPI0011E6ECF7|nr:mechanosensitive ion channel domain-containing protein [Oceanicella actignis]TYO88584.1 mechanosensitive ion channel-like protein [Oceanicella actignis]